jgi:pilus assembly protein CpaF
VRLVGRGANVEGAGAIGAADLVRQALRMRPDRLVVGEFRGAEFIELVIALNTGHDGGAATLHANSAADVPARFAALGAQAGVPSAAVHVQVASAFQLVIALRREHGGARRVDEIALLERGGDELRLAPVWTPHGIGPGAARLARMIAQREVPVPELLR